MSTANITSWRHFTQLTTRPPPSPSPSTPPPPLFLSSSTTKMMTTTAAAATTTAATSSLMSSTSCNVIDCKGDLFSCPEDYALAHCVSSDLVMGKGIAVLFKRTFGGVNELKRQNVGVGGVASLKCDDRYVFYLITKQMWLFGYEFPDTVMLFTRSSLHILASKKKMDVLKQIEPHMPSGITLHFLERQKSDQNASNFKKLLSTITSKQLGHVAKDTFGGDIFSGWSAAVTAAQIELVDVAAGIGWAYTMKDSREVELLQAAAKLSADTMKKAFVAKITVVFELDKRITHMVLAEHVEDALLHPDKKDIPISEELRDSCESCYLPIVQSGGHYDLKASAMSNGNNLHFGTIICSLGGRIRSYCSNLARTFLVDPTKDQEANYNTLLSAMDALIAAMKVGTPIKELYSAFSDSVTKDNAALASHITKNAGFGTGLEFRDSALVINSKNEILLSDGMAFSVSVGLNRLKRESDGSEYALFLADTVVMLDGTPVILTEKSSKKLTNISFINDGGDGDDDSDALDEDDVEDIKGSRRTRGVVLEKRTRTENTVEISDDAKRRLHQKKLMERLNQRRLDTLGSETDAERGPTAKDIVAYKLPSQLPRNTAIREMRIFYDKKHESVILPIYGLAVPFHVSAIKSVNVSQQGALSYLRINLQTPGASYSSASVVQFSSPLASFLKEMSFRSSDDAVLQKVVTEIKEGMKRVRQAQAELKERENLVEQDQLQLAKNRNVPRLKDLYVRPNLSSGKRCMGTLEAHANGFRFTGQKGEKQDIIYSNIRHAFFQPCDGEMIVCLHFHLRHGILIGKKKRFDVQFFTEVIDASQDLSNRRSNMYDRDELEEEQRERAMKKRINDAFKSFVQKVEDAAEGRIEFDIPYRKLGFSGVPPHHQSCLLLPTTNCLVNLTEQPQFVISLDDLELVHCERVQFSLKNFDLVFVFKDYKQKPVMVNAVPMDKLESIQEWLDSCDIKYTQGPMTLNWARIMKTINADSAEFFRTGGWTFLEDDGSDDGGSAEDSDVESEFEPSDSDDESSDDDDMSSEEDDDSDASEDDSDASEYSDEESGKDWSDLEEEARKADHVANAGDEEFARRNGPKNRTPAGNRKRGIDEDNRQVSSSSKHKKRRY